MKRSLLASRLAETRGTKERRKLLADNRRLADVRLARALKDECYRVWTSAPAGARGAASALKDLAAFSPSPEINAIRSWVEGIADITRGKLEPAISDLDTASRLLRKLGHEHESAQPQVAKLIALAMLGRYDEARRAGEKALKIFERYKDQLAAGKIEMNLSNVVSRRDQYSLAEQFCRSAYRRFKKIGERTWLAMAANGLANTYAELNDFRRAEKFYAEALEIARLERMGVTIAEIESSMGNLALFRGRFAEALRRLEESRQKYESLEMPHQSAVAELEIADIYAELNLNSEAIEMYDRLVPKLRRLRMRAEEARARANFGRALISIGDVRQAGAELRRATSLFRSEKNEIAAAAVQLRLASLDLSQGKPDSALTIVDDAERVLRGSGNVRLALSASWLRGEILTRLGMLDEAEAVLRTVRTNARNQEQPSISLAAANSLGNIARESRRTKQAERYFNEAISQAERARDPLPGEEFRMAFLAKTLEPYENLAGLYLSTGDVNKAFATFERARSRSLLESVTTKTSRTDSTLREQLNWSYSRLARADADEARKIEKEIQKREKQLADATRRAQSIASATYIAKHDVDVGEITARLGDKKALVEFVERDGVYSAFVVTREKIEFVADIARAEEVLALLEGLRFQFGALRFGTSALGSFAAQLKSRADSYLGQLHAKLFAPVAEFLDARDVVVVPAGVLNYVPFAALFDGQEYLVESREVSCCPSASVWARLNLKPASRPRNALLMAYADESIPLVDDEVTRLAELLPNSTTVKGKRSTFDAFEENAHDFDLIHLACHGQFRPDNPTFSSLHLADGWVTVRDVTSHRLKAGLVTLSACETGLSKIFAGEELIGLARGFLSAGARSLLLTLWTVNDEAATRLMSDFYVNLQRGETASASLRIAQRGFIERGQHPYFWSPFFLIG